MIMYLAPGEPSYLPDGLFTPLHDEAFPDLAPMIHRCADRRIPWDIIAFLAAATDWCSHQEIARSLGSTPAEVMAQLEAPVQAGLIQERLLAWGPHYRFQGNYRLRAFFGRPYSATAVSAPE